MQPLSLIIPGSYYDSQIYSGRLYLWGTDGSITILDWDALLESVNVPDRLVFALHCAFQQSEYLYGNYWKLIFQDPEIKPAIQQKFQDLAEKPITFTAGDLEKHIIQKQDNPSPFPHADTTIYYNMLYVGSQSGLTAASCDRVDRSHPLDPQPEKLWDGPVFSVDARYRKLALAAGSDGLFEYHLDSERKPLRQLSPLHASSAHWLYASVFSSSYFTGGYLADFTRRWREEEVNEEGWEWYEGEELGYRKFLGIVPSADIFGHIRKNGSTAFAWGLHDKICLATHSAIEVVRYTPDRENRRFNLLGPVAVDNLPADIISADSSVFGYVVEGAAGLLVIDSSLERTWLAGEPVNWRVFPRSRFYENQLHVMYDDHLHVYSFNQDYFVDQATKRVGISHYKAFARSQRPPVLSR